MRRLWDRLPVRRRVALVLSAALSLVLAASGLYIYARMGAELDTAVDQGLRSRTGDLTALIRQADSGLAQAGRSPLTERGESVAQIVTPSGRVVDAPPVLRRSPLLTRAQLRTASRRPLVVNRIRSPVDGGWIRVRATAVDAQGRRLVVVVGAALKERDEALQGLKAILLVVGAGALLLTSLAGYVAVRRALRPVELMTRRARGIQTSSLGQRLPVSPAGDELTHLGETLNAMLDRLQQGFARERAFVDDASHELRSPLTILRGELELALRDASSPDDFRLAVGSAATEADRVIALAEDLLILARADQRRRPVRPSEFNARGLLEEVAASAGLAAEIDADPNLVVRADRAALGRAVSNLVDNALRYGGGRVELSARGGNDVVVAVADDGPGFAPDFLPRAFERFTRADEARARGGAGLGLSIVAAIAATHGGTVYAANRPGGGAVVTITLPGPGTTKRPPARGAEAALS
jgi:signal transduction histidine kinase